MRHSVSFIPYFPDEGINELIGEFRLWNWYRYSEQIVSDGKVWGWLSRYFGLYKTATGKAESRIAVVSPANGDLFPADQDLFKQSRFNNALMACYLFNLPLAQDWPVCLADNFTGLNQPFDEEQNDLTIAFKFGSYAQVAQTGSWDYLRFATPQFVPDMGQCKPVNRLLGLLVGLCLDKSENTNRLFRSLEWLRMAFLNYENVPYDVRVVAMCSAFESLLDFPDFGKSEHFSKTVNGLLPANKIPTSSRQVGKKILADTVVGWWCRDFYALRSKVVHGEEIDAREWQYATGAEHLKIAINIFEECLWGLVTNWGLLAPGERMEEFVWRSNWRDLLGVQMSAFI